MLEIGLLKGPSNRPLTTGADEFTGDVANDRFIATATTLNAGDVLAGGAGVDTLSLSADLSANAAVAGFTLSGVENVVVNLTDGAAAAHTLSMNMVNSNAATLTASGLSTTTANDAVTFNNVAAGTTIALVNATDLNVNANFVAAATTGTANAVAVSLNGVASTAAGDTTLTIGTGFETINVATSGAASRLNDIVTGAATTMVISGDQNLTVRAALDASLTRIDASLLTGRLAIATANNAAPDTLVSLVDVADITVFGGSGNDTIDVSANAADNEIVVDAGAGDDTVTIGAALAAGTATLAQDTLNGGDGTDTLVYTSAGFAALTDDDTVGVSNFEALSVSDALATNITVANVQATGISTVTLAAGGTGGLTMAAGAVNVALGASLTGALALTDTGTGTSDSVTLSNVATVADDMGDANNLTVTGYETVNIVTTAVGDTSQDFGTITVTADTGGSTSVNFSGSDRATVGAITAVTINASGLAAAATGTTFDMTAAAVGVTTITGSAGADVLRGDAASTINGGAGNDTIIGGTGNDRLNGDDGNDSITTNTGTDVVSGGAGNDTFVAAGNLTAGDTFNGGDGTDTLSVTDASLTALAAFSLSQANAFNTGLVGVERLTITDALNQGSFDLGRVASVSTFTINDFTGNETLTGLDSGETVNIQTGPTNVADILTLTLNDAATGTADAITVGLTASATEDYGVLGLANVETITINVTEATASDTVIAATVGLNITQATGGAAQTVNVIGLESLTVDTAIAARTINASGMTAALATDAGLNMGAAFTATAVITGQTIIGSDKVDTLRGSTGADVINGGAGADTIHGGTGADTIDGGTGTDTYHTTGMVGAAIEGTGTGTSTGVVVNLSDAAISNVTVTNNGGQNISGAVTSVAAGTAAYVYATVSPNHSSVVDTLTSIENVTLSGNGTNYVVGSAGANVINGGTGIDFIDGGAGNDTINGGTGADVMTGGSGTDTFVFAAGDTGTPSATNFDEIIGFATASDVIDHTAAISIVVNAAAAAAGVAAISAAGIATFDAADDTLAERITAVEGGIATGTATAGQTAAFMFGTDAYVFISDGVDGVGANDVLVRLTGVDLTTAAFDTLTIAGNNLTIA